MTLKRIIMIVLAASLAWAQEKKAAPAGSWNRVMSIAPGADTKVKRQGVKKHLSGKFVSANPDSIRIRGAGGEVSIPKSEIEQVSVARNKKARNTLLGLGIGAGAGFGIVGGAALAVEKEDADSVAHGFAALGLVIGAAVGAPLGFASGGGFGPVYEVAAGPPATK